MLTTSSYSPPTIAAMKTSRRCGRALFSLPALALTLAACGGSGGAQSQVASLPGTAAASASSTTSAADANRPQTRLDSTQQELKALDRVYYQCEKDHGHRMQGDGYAPDPGDHSATAAAADQACESKRPLPPPEMVQATNPHYLDDYREWISCINAHGVPVKATDPFGSGWTFSGTVNVPEDAANKIEQDCQVEAFSR